MWLAEVRAKENRHNQILFSKESFLLADLRHLIEQTNRRVLILWALELAEETALQLAERYPEDLRPREAIDTARAWAAGEIKMPTAKQAILNCHAMAKELISGQPSRIHLQEFQYNAVSAGRCNAPCLPDSQTCF